MTTTRTRYDSVYVMSANAPYEPPLRALHRGDRYARRTGSTSSRRISIDDRKNGVGVRFAGSPGAPAQSERDDSEASTITSPRHRHNFDQIRYMPQGGWYGEVKCEPGTLGYFPEGVYYGPTRQPQVRERVSHASIVIQFTGPSQSELLPFDETAKLSHELAELGVTFPDGIAHWPDGRKQDGFEALWEYNEQKQGRAVEYPPARYASPVFIQPQGMTWVATEKTGVLYKHLGYFNESGPNINFLRLEPGVSTSPGQLGCYQLRYVLEGSVLYEDEELPASSALYYPPGVRYEGLQSRDGATLLVMQAKSRNGEAPPLHVF